MLDLNTIMNFSDSTKSRSRNLNINKNNNNENENENLVYIPIPVRGTNIKLYLNIIYRKYKNKGHYYLQ